MSSSTLTDMMPMKFAIVRLKQEDNAVSSLTTWQMLPGLIYFKSQQ